MDLFSWIITNEKFQELWKHITEDDLCQEVSDRLKEETGEAKWCGFSKLNKEKNIPIRKKLHHSSDTENKSIPLQTYK